jgi:hypothetical protein
MMINERRAVGGMRIGREAEVLGENLSHCHIAQHKSHMTGNGFNPRPLSYEAGD